jgi:hypothetical protein
MCYWLALHACFKIIQKPLTWGQYANLFYVQRNIGVEIVFLYVIKRLLLHNFSIASNALYHSKIWLIASVSKFCAALPHTCLDRIHLWTTLCLSCSSLLFKTKTNASGFRKDVWPKAYNGSNKILFCKSFCTLNKTITMRQYHSHRPVEPQFNRRISCTQAMSPFLETELQQYFFQRSLPMSAPQSFNEKRRTQYTQSL